MYTSDELSRMESFIKGQNEVMSMITHGDPLPGILNRLTSWVEEESSNNLKAVIFRLDDEGKFLYHAAGKSLPPAYLDAIDGMKVSENSACCGRAAYQKKTVVVTNIAESDFSEEFREAASVHGLRACWSTPLINQSGEVRGTFGVYFDEVKKPDEAETQLISLVSQTALLAIEFNIAEVERKKHSEAARVHLEDVQKSGQRFQSLVRDATVGIVVLIGEDLVVEIVNEMYARLIGRKPKDILHKPIFSIVPEAEEAYKGIIEEVRISGIHQQQMHAAYTVFADDEEITGYVNVFYQPYRETGDEVTGVMIFCHDITEIVKAKQELEKSEAAFRELVEQAPVAIAVFKGTDLIAELANDSYLPLIQLSREDFIGKSLYETVPHARTNILPLAVELFETGKPFFTNEVQVNIHRNGRLEKCYFNSLGKPTFSPDGKVDGFISVAHEVTGLVEARRSLQEEQQNIRSIIESAPFPIGVYVGREMRIQFLNRAIMDVWGKGYDVVGKLYSEVLPELANQHIYEQLDQVYTTGIPFHARNQQVDLVVNGKLQPFYFNYSFTPLYDSRGNIYGVMNTAAEVTELVKAYNNLEESEARARLAIEASGQGTYHINLLTDELEASPRLAEIFDIDGTNERDRYVSAIHPEDLEVRKEAFRVAYQTGSLAYDGRIIRKDGATVWIRVKGKIYFDEEGTPQKLVGVVQDITEQKYFAEALEQKVEQRTTELADLNKQLLAINDELQQFAYVASHDMQEPLRKIRVFSDILSQEVTKESREAKFVEKINSAAERMTGLIHGLLEYSRASDNRMRYEEVNLNQLLKNVLTDFELLASQKGAEIRIGELPTIMAVSLQMNQLFYNLVGNSLKFTRSGERPVIDIRSNTLTAEKLSNFPGLDKEKDYVEITVRDNGIGFDQEYAPKIFTVFQRLNDRNKYSGYGIGLALCKKVVEAHQGVITAEGEINKGAKFTIILPVKQDS